MTNDRDALTVSEHYGRADLGRTILEALGAAGKDPDRLTIEDLAPVDQFHTRGMESTLELARLAGMQEGERVLDVGGGRGGPARTLAARFGCTVTVLDLTEPFCRAGEELTRRTDLADPSLVRQSMRRRVTGPSPHSSISLERGSRRYAPM